LVGRAVAVDEFNVVLVKVALAPGKTPSGVTLPDVSARRRPAGVPSMHVFGIAVG
jgi:hypothetical protein